MAARTKPAAEEPEVKEPEEPKAEAVSDDEALTAKIEAVVKSLMPAAPEAREVEAEPQTARQEESRAASLVADAINEFKDALKGTEKEAPKSEPEEAPGKKKVRWVEKYLWGVDG